MKTKLLTFAFLLLALAGCSKNGDTITINTSYGAWEAETINGTQSASVYLSIDHDFELDEYGERLIVGAPYARINMIPISNGNLNGNYNIKKDDPSAPGDADLYLCGYDESLGWMSSGTVAISDGKIVCTAKSKGGKNVVINFKGELKFAEYGIDEIPE